MQCCAVLCCAVQCSEVQWSAGSNLHGSGGDCDMRGWRQALGSAQGGVGRRQDLDLEGEVAPGVQVQHLKQQPHLLLQS